ncbi:hypothetical protein pEaSNUABM25_00329 [Erwinia phage pEa_SNUABM_25]|nr:hypothetical protein pEaSNUABM25_00329 [Erwinia phage pEa_SNUABM_25]
MSKQEVFNRLDDLHSKERERSKQAKQGPSYFELTNLRIEAAARLARALQTLKAANVVGDVEGISLQEDALEVAQAYWTAILDGLTPVAVDGSPMRKLLAGMPACIEAFRVVVMESAMREHLVVQCNAIADDIKGFPQLTGHVLPTIQHTCEEGCNCGSITE